VDEPILISGSEIVTVSELTRAVRENLESHFPPLWVSGEISNFTRASSGHWYFSLKDSSAQVRCVMFRHRNQYLDWLPENGMQAEVFGQVSLYEPRGDFQLNAESLRRAGLGKLFEAFARLKEKLGKEGLFEEGHKKSLPGFPAAIGIITSPAAAALRDVLTTLRRRMPSIPVILYPTAVQGEGAAAQIAGMIKTAAARRECDVLILCRGGGSMEDLWAFNEEQVAWAIYASPIPIVCGVGHEVDFTISDFVADVRAPTPTAAAEMASPNRTELLEQLADTSVRLLRLARNALEVRMQQLDYLSRRLQHPDQRLRQYLEHVQHLRIRFMGATERLVMEYLWSMNQLAHRLRAARPDVKELRARCRELTRRLKLGMRLRLESLRSELKRLKANLTHLNPQSVLHRGFSIAEHAEGGIIRDSHNVQVGDSLKVTFARGWAQAEVKRKN
jgi:exodeoxyribonuclease VII large subunit